MYICISVRNILLKHKLPHFQDIKKEMCRFVRTIRILLRNYAVLNSFIVVFLIYYAIIALTNSVFLWKTSFVRLLFHILCIFTNVLYLPKYLDTTAATSSSSSKSEVIS